MINDIKQIQSLVERKATRQRKKLFDAKRLLETAIEALEKRKKDAEDYKQYLQELEENIYKTLTNSASSVQVIQAYFTQLEEAATETLELVEKINSAQQEKENEENNVDHETLLLSQIERRQTKMDEIKKHFMTQAAIELAAAEEKEIADVVEVLHQINKP